MLFSMHRTVILISLFPQTPIPGTTVDLEIAKPSEILVSNTDSEAWNLEVERAAPKLKVTVRADGRDWRSHLEQVSGHITVIVKT